MQKPEHKSDGGGSAGLFGRLVLVRAGEGRPLVWAAACFFCWFTGYFAVRPVREAMGVAGGADKLPWLVTGTLLAMVAVNPVFSWVVSRWPRRVFIPWVYAMAAISMLTFFAFFTVLPNHGGVNLGYAFYIWLSVINLFPVSVFWALMADGFSPEQARRLFGCVGIGGTLGAIAGAAVASRLTKGVLGLPAVPPHDLLLVAALFMLGAAACSRRLIWLFGFGRAGSPGAEGEGAGSGGAGSGGAVRSATREPGPGVLAGLTLIARSRYLQLICAYIFVFTITSQLLYLEQGRIVEAAFPDKKMRTAAFADIDLYANVLTLLVQTFLTARVIRWIGVGGTLAIVPALSIIGFLALWSSPTLGVLMVFQVVRRGMHYALDRPARESLFTVVSADEKYKSKSFIDTAVYRAGDLGGAWLPTWLGMLPGTLGLPLAAVWLIIAASLGPMQRKRISTPTSAPQTRR